MSVLPAVCLTPGPVSALPAAVRFDPPSGGHLQASAGRIQQLTLVRPTIPIREHLGTAGCNRRVHYGVSAHPLQPLSPLRDQIGLVCEDRAAQPPPHDVTGEGQPLFLAFFLSTLSSCSHHQRCTSTLRSPRTRHTVHPGYNRGTTRVQLGYNRGTTGIQPGYNRGTTRVQPGYHRGTTGIQPGYSWGTTGVQLGYNRGTTRVQPGYNGSTTREGGGGGRTELRTRSIMGLFPPKSTRYNKFTNAQKGGIQAFL